MWSFNHVEGLCTTMFDTGIVCVIGYSWVLIRRLSSQQPIVEKRWYHLGLSSALINPDEGSISFETLVIVMS